MSVGRGSGSGTGTAWTIISGSASPIDSSNGTIDGSHTNTYLVAAVAHDSGATITAVALDPAGTNQALSFLGTVSNPGGGQVGELWTLPTPTAVTGKPLRVTFSGSGTVNISGAYYTGVLGGVTFSSTNGTGTSASLSITTANGDATFSLVFDDKTQALSNPGTGAQTTISISNSVIDTGIGDALSTTSSDNHVWSYGGSVPWGIAAVRIKASAGAASTQSTLTMLGVQ